MPHQFGHRSGAPAAKRRKVTKPANRNKNGSRAFKIGTSVSLKSKSIARTGITTVSRTYRDVGFFTAAHIVTDSGGLQGVVGFAPKLSDLPGYGDYTNIYDQYRLKSAEYFVMPRFLGNVDDDPGGADPMPVHAVIFGWVGDPNDSDVSGVFSTTEDAWLKINGYQQDLFQAPVRITTNPKPSTTMYRTSTTTGTAQGDGSKWISRDNPTIPHYGMKMRWYLPEGNFGTTDIGNMAHVYITLTFEFRKST